MALSSRKREQIIEHLNQVQQQVGNRTVLFTHAIANHIGLTATEFECLDFLQHTGPVPAGHLAKLTGLTSGAISGVCARLERAGFLRRRADPADRRRTLVEAQEDEAAMAQTIALYGPLSREWHKLISHYSNEELQIITRYLEESHALIDRLAGQMSRPKSR
ncbi:MAG TPA: helix-turn-helix domain-containing protein [Candidatus Saccharimonadia bacterium]